MSQKMSREELIELTEAIVSMYDKNTKRKLDEEEHVALAVKFNKSINHPGGTDLIFYPELVGLPRNPSVYEIVDLAMKGIPEEINEEIHPTVSPEKNYTNESKETFISRMNNMSQKMSREELIELTEAVMTKYDKYTKKDLEDDEVDAVRAKFIKSINHPGGIDLIEDPKSFGLPSHPSVYEIVDLAMKGDTRKR